MVRYLIFILMALSASAAPDTGRLINRNYAHAIKALQLAEKGDPVAQYEFALMCERGEGVSQNHSEAVKWFRNSAAQDYAPAQLFLGMMYASGKGVSKSMAEALKWLNLAAEQDNTIAQFYLGGIYFSSTAVPQDYIKAYKWFALAGRAESTRAASLDALGRKMTPSQVTEAQRQVAVWNPRNPK